LVLDEVKSVGAVAHDLVLTETALREWVKRAWADRTKGRTGLTTAEREELAPLRKENRELRTEREILKKSPWTTGRGMCASCRTCVVPPSALPAVFTSSNGDEERWRLDEARRTFEERFVRAALVRAGGHRGRAASELGGTRQGLTKLLTRLGIATAP
jgi:DNA-binding NtrC family response regulator